jgi:antitoxin component HigA of HigAB toxin-antitoxin module
MTVEELFGTLQMAVVAGWRKHLRTAKYAKHAALDEFYKEMPEKVDALIEAYMGAYGKKIGAFQNVLSSSNMNTLKYLNELKRVCKEGYDLLDENEELEGLLDDIVNLINSTLYKVKELNEGRMDLAEYISEAINEAKLDLNAVSPKELIYFYWEAWSGWESQGKREGLSGNPRATKIANFINDVKFPTNDYFGSVTEKVMDLDEHLKKMFGVGEFEQYDFRNRKIAAAMMKLIDDNIDWLTDGKHDKNYKIK